MKRTFVTFATDNYMELAKVLHESIVTFSNYDLKIYTPNDIYINSSDLKNYRCKILTCLKAIEDGYDEIVWIDTDCVVTNNIDKIWFEGWRIEDYPLLPKHRFFNYHLWVGNRPTYNDPNFMSLAKSKVGVVNDFEDIYLQGCFILFNKNCKSFFDEVLLYYENYDSTYFQFGDESILNCLIWKRNGGNLGSIFLCSSYFHPDCIEEFISIKDRNEFVKLFNKSIFSKGFGYGFWEDHNNSDRTLDFPFPIIENNFENILFLHGTKDPILHKHYIDLMIKKRLKL